MKPPETPVSSGHEQKALDAHINKVTNQAVLKRVRRFTQELEQEERAKQKLVRVILIGALFVVVLVLAVVIFSH